MLWNRYTNYLIELHFTDQWILRLHWRIDCSTTFLQFLDKVSAFSEQIAACHWTNLINQPPAEKQRLINSSMKESTEINYCTEILIRLLILSYITLTLSDGSFWAVNSAVLFACFFWSTESSFDGVDSSIMIGRTGCARWLLNCFMHLWRTLWDFSTSALTE